MSQETINFRMYIINLANDLLVVMEELSSNQRTLYKKENQLNSHLKLSMTLFVLLTCVFVELRSSKLYGEDFQEELCPFISYPAYTVNCEVKALYLQPTASNLNYAAKATTLPALSPDWAISEIKPDYHWGFDVKLDYIFCERNLNIALSWDHFYSKDFASRELPPVDLIGPFFEVGPEAFTFKNAFGEVVFDYDSVNLDCGFFVDIDRYLRTNLFFGINAVRLKQTLTSQFSSFDELTVRKIKTPSTFTGAGPSLGFDFSYNIANGFYVNGGGTASLLVGTLKNHTKYESLSPLLPFLGITPPHEQTTTVDNKTQLIPSFGGRLGVSYCMTFCDCYTLNIEAGYEARVYINAIQSVDIGSELVTPPIAPPNSVGVYARTFDRTLSNFALAGPYLVLNIGF